VARFPHEKALYRVSLTSIFHSICSEIMSIMLMHLDNVSDRAAVFSAGITR